MQSAVFWLAEAIQVEPVYVAHDLMLCKWKTAADIGDSIPTPSKHASHTVPFFTV